MKRKSEPKPDPRWTHVDLTGDEFLALCARAARGELRIQQFGVGSSNALWCAAVREPGAAAPAPESREEDLPW